METILITVAVLVGVVIVGLLIFLINNNSASRRDNAEQAITLKHLAENIESYKATQNSLKDNLQKSLQTGQENVHKSLRSNLETMANLQKQIGALQEASKQIKDMGTDVRSLQQILASPKMRGQLGEWSLENLLANVLPTGTFELQYEFKDGKRVDALVKMPDYSVPIDAKFPLPGFEAMMAEEDKENRAKLRRGFLRDVVKHIDKIADLYIRPGEGTLDFAMMYIPAENVYYEIITKQPKDSQDVLEYALSKKVIPISPNVCYAYLMTIVMGLHGLQIEKQAAEIRQNLNGLKGKFDDFANTWGTMGKHFRNAQSQYQEGQVKLDKFGLEMEQIGNEKSEG